MTTKNIKISPLGLLIWSLGALFFMYEFFLRTFVGSVAHQIIPDLHLNAESFATLGTAYYIAYAVMQIPVGILTDKLGLKIVLAAATLLCAVATLLFTHSTGLTTALISRVLMGLGSAFAFVCLLVILVNWFPRKYFGSLSGLSQFVGTMGPILGGGPLIMLMASHHENWRQALSTIAYFGVALSVLVILFVKNKPSNGPQKLIFLQKDRPLALSLKILAKSKQAWFIAIYSAAIYVSIALLGAIWGTEYLQARGLSQSNAATMISLSWLGYAIGCPLLGFVSDTLKRRKPILTFCAIIGFCVTSSILYLPLSQSQLAYGALFFMLGIAASGQNIGFATIAEQVDKKTKATALGLNNGAIMITAALVPAIVSYSIYSTSHGSAHLVTHDFQKGLSIMPLLCFVAFLTSIFLIKETFCKPQKDKIILDTTHH